MYQPSQHNYQQPARQGGHTPVQPPLSLNIHPPQTAAYAAYNMSTSAGANLPPPSPSQNSEAANDEANFNLPGPPPVSRIWEGRAWALEVVQQPVRARMCGFGDKVWFDSVHMYTDAKASQDRRPISPPPCIRLLIFDPKTGDEINYEYVVVLCV